MLLSQFWGLVTVDIYDFHYECVFPWLDVAVNRIIGLLIKQNTDVSEKIHCLCTLTQISSCERDKKTWLSEFLQVETEKKRLKEIVTAENHQG